MATRAIANFEFICPDGAGAAFWAVVEGACAAHCLDGKAGRCIAQRIFGAIAGGLANACYFWRPAFGACGVGRCLDTGCLLCNPGVDGHIHAVDGSKTLAIAQSND